MPAQTFAADSKRKLRRHHLLKQISGPSQAVSYMVLSKKGA